MMGNYLFCARCVCTAFHISSQRLARQRAVERAESQSPMVEMVKLQVEDERLGQYVVMLLRCDEFQGVVAIFGEHSDCLSAIPTSDHGNALKPSNSAKSGVMNDFLTFVDSNS